MHVGVIRSFVTLRGISAPNERFGDLSQIPAVIALKLGRSSSSKPSLWNSQSCSLESAAGLLRHYICECDIPEVWQSTMTLPASKIQTPEPSEFSSPACPIYFITLCLLEKLKLYSAVILTDLELLCPLLCLQMLRTNTSLNILIRICPKERQTDILGNLRLLRE